MGFKIEPDEVTKKHLAILNSTKLSDELKQKIGSEYHRLLIQNPKWKRHRVMRKAGEKFGIKMKFE